MPRVTKTVVEKKTIVSGPRLAVSSQLRLPTTKNRPPVNFHDYAVGIFGEKGIGKTSLAAQFQNAIINQFEPGRRHLEVYQQAITSWSDFKEYLELELGDKRFDSLAIDTVDRAYSLCMDYVCANAGVAHPHDAKDFGKTWKEVTTEFEETMNSIRFGGKAPVFISHAKYKTVEDALTRETKELYCPTCPDKAWEYMRAVCDFVFCCTYRGTERVIAVRGTDTIWASCGVPNTFLHAKSGKPLAEIPMGSTPEEAYRNLCLGFENKMLGRVLSEPLPEAEESKEAPKALPKRK